MISWMFLSINLTFIPLSSGFPVDQDIVWEQSTTPATIGKNVTLICFVRANSGEYFGWYRQPSMETLAHQNISSNKAKYDVSVEFVDPFYEYKLTILEVEFNDLNRIYICSNFDKEYPNVLKMTENTFIFKPQIQDVKKRIWMDNGKMKAEIIIPHVYPEPTCVLESKDNQIQPVRMSRQNTSTDIFEIRYSFDVLPCVGNVSMMCTIHDELVLQDVIAFNMTDCNTGEEKEQGLVIVISVVITVVCACLLVTVIIVICRRKKEGKCVCAKRNRSYRLPKNRPCENGNAIDNEGGENPRCTSYMILQKISC